MCDYGTNGLNQAITMAPLELILFTRLHMP
jgi:hypothetical protein